MLNQVGTSHRLAAPVQSLPKHDEGPDANKKSNWRHEVAVVRFFVASADYVPRTRWGKVCYKAGVPDVQLRLGEPKKGKRTMSAFEELKEELEHYEQMFGRNRGRLAVSLDRLTNALVLVGQHGVYCTSQRNPAVPAMDLRTINQELVHAKELVRSVMEELKLAKQNSQN
jgi:hypothetical protein